MGSYDAIVVGSGYGGSVAACRLSQSGLRVCILEKGREWKSDDFPTSIWQVLCNTRIHTPSASIGSSKALYQLHFQGDSMAMVGSGLGGGSLVNAGVLLPTPMRAQNDPRWPKEWHKDWHHCEKRATAMLDAEIVPFSFANTKVMDAISTEIENCIKDSLQLNIVFKERVNVAGQKQSGCLACGNCFTGCPYNAKNSMDKNYLALARQAGAIVRTECQVQFVLPNNKGVLACDRAVCCGTLEQAHRIRSGKEERRWRVYVNETDYLLSDYVVLSAGVFGTTQILLQSKDRGLRLSEKLGFGFSCNGNNVAYVAGARAPTKAYGLTNKQLADTPMPVRPGPSITNSYTSSLGFTVQGAILPSGYPYILFKGITTYSFGSGYGILYGLMDKLKCCIKTVDSEAIILNAIGYDLADGRLKLDRGTGKLRFFPPQDPLLTKKVSTFQKLAKRMGGVLFMSRYRASCVHLLGGCNAAKDATEGVANSNGQVFSPCATSDSSADETTCCSTSVHKGLYVCDASLIPCSVGLNPSLTIATLAEHVSSCLLQDQLDFFAHKPTEKKAYKVYLTECDGGNMISGQDALISRVIEANNCDVGETNIPKQTIPVTSKRNLSTNNISNDHEDHMLELAGCVVRETLSGYLGGIPCRLHLVMHMGVAEDAFCKDSRYGLIKSDMNQFGEAHPLLRGRVGGYCLMAQLDANVLHVIDGRVNMCWTSSRSPFTHYMHYHLLLASASGAKYVLDAQKEMRPFLFGALAWQETTTLHATLSQANHTGRKCNHQKPVILHGRSPRSLSTQGVLAPHYSEKQSSANQVKYPPHIVQTIITDDGVAISCRQWRCNNQGKIESQPVLLLNGYSSESFYLPTEETDLVRTLLDNGYEPWLLHTRYDPIHCTTRHFTFDDVARFDIPSAFARIKELRGDNGRIHVVGHCVGGLSVHMALLGGYLPATSVESIICTNSSMFFHVTPLAVAKLMLPLISVCMRILGSNTVLSLTDRSEDNWRHRMVKQVARIIPRIEKCTCEECEVFSGIFGSTFWHANVNTRVHDWLNKQAVTKLPMAAFPHLQRICKAGKIVGPVGEDKYLPFPERMAVPTTYIAGGRSLLVQSSTCELAHSFMQMHHPQLQHRCYKIHGYGHSDLLIGELAERDVFPYILDSLAAPHERDPPLSGSIDESAEWRRPSSRRNCNLVLLEFIVCLIFVVCFFLGRPKIVDVL